MSFTSIEFILFLCITVLLYFIFPINRRWCVLLTASGVFYCLAGIKYIPFIAITSFVTYFTALFIDHNYSKLDLNLEQEGLDKEQKKILKDKCKEKCRRVLIAALIVTFGILCYTKFGSGFLEIVQNVFDIIGIRSLEVPEISIIVPLGISYYTFSSIGYVLDVYWRRYGAEKEFFKYLLYILYFPHILQGPIARYDKLAPQLITGHKFEYHRMCFGIQLML